jgi:hypothetical protein
MSLTVNGSSGNHYSFEGPYLNTSSLAERSGVYLILCKNENGEYNPIDIGESGNVKYRVENHDRKDCWSNNCTTQLFVAVLYAPHKQQSGRMAIEQDIRSCYSFPCGKR